MDIRFKELDIENFRSINKAHIVLENQGTVIVRGINEYEDNATSNGSGKSSIFEAIVFALFEETSSGEKDVANRIINNGFCINLKLEIDGIEYTIVRESKKGNKSIVVIYKNDVDISARNKTDTNKLIQDLLGINKNIFLDSVFLSQSVSTNLASLSPTQRKERLEILTNTDITINNFKEKLKEQQTNFESICVDTEKNINKIQGNIDSLQNQKQNIQIKIDEINEQIRQRDLLGNVEDIEKQLKELQQNSDNYKMQINDLDNNIITDIEKQIEDKRLEGEENRNQKSELEKQLNDKRQEYNNIQLDITSVQSQIGYYKSDIIKINEQIEEIKNSDKCPTCGRKYENSNEKHIKQKIESYNKDIESYNKQIEDMTKEVEEKNKQLELVQNEGIKLHSQVDEIDSLVQQNNNEVKQIEDIKKQKIQEKFNLQQQQQVIEQNIQNLRDKKEQILSFKVGNIDEFKQMLLDTDNNLQTMQKDLEVKQEELETNNNYVGSIKHSLQLVTKDFRTYLLQNSITYLNTLLKNYSIKLFSNEKDIIHITQDDTKLNIQLGDATYESLSGGEKTRVNIALLLAQKSLASTIGNISCNIIILDEILGYCDAQAEENVINLITMELESLESIYMVSHKEIPIAYDTQLIVIKNKSGLSSIRCY